MTGVQTCALPIWFRIFRFSVCFLFGQNGAISRCQVITSFHCNCVVLSLFGKNKKHIIKMTWQLTAKSNRGCDLLTESNVRVSNQSFETLGCKIQSPPNVRGVLCNLANLFSFGKLYIIMYHGKSNFTSCALSNVLLSCRTFSWCLRFTISYFCWLNFKAILVACWHWYFSYFVQPWILMEI